MTNREQHLKAVMTGRRSRAAGGAWEELLEASCRHYRLKGAAEITKTPEPMKPIGPKNAKGQFLACYTKKAQPDYKGGSAAWPGRRIRGKAHGQQQATAQRRKRGAGKAARPPYGAGRGLLCDGVVWISAVFQNPVAGFPGYERPLRQEIHHPRGRAGVQGQVHRRHSPFLVEERRAAVWA